MIYISENTTLIVKLLLLLLIHYCCCIKIVLNKHVVDFDIIFQRLNGKCLKGGLFFKNIIQKETIRRRRC